MNKERRKGGRQRGFKSETSQEDQINIDESNPFLAIFRELSIKLDEKHDRYERIIKISRDITIESKRIIHLLHQKDTNSELKKQQIFDQAEERLNKIVKNQFKAIALELEGQDPYQYLKAYTGGIQEFIEANLFYQYLSEKEILNCEKLQKRAVYQIETQSEDEVVSREVKLLIPEMDFMLGVLDFTGELMRKCINSLGDDNLDTCFKTCRFVKEIYAQFLGTNTNGLRELKRKIVVLKQSLSKMEMVCFNIRIRGSEVPKHMLALVATSIRNDGIEEDEGIF